MTFAGCGRPSPSQIRGEITNFEYKECLYSSDWFYDDNYYLCFSQKKSKQSAEILFKKGQN